jgi:hypothetical protein
MSDWKTGKEEKPRHPNSPLGKGAPLGNQNAQKRNRRWREALERAIIQDDGDRLRKIAEKLLNMAAAGDIQAIKELGNRLDGAVAQQIELRNPENEEGESMPVTINIVGV